MKLSFKVGVAVPVFEGKGLDLLNLLWDNSLSSIIAKSLEIAIQNRLKPILDDKPFPHYAQTVYKSEISWADAIF